MTKNFKIDEEFFLFPSDNNTLFSIVTSVELNEMTYASH